MLDNTDRG